MEINVFIDGAARGNPGDAGVGIFISGDGKTILEAGYFLGKKTNNQAEYLALVYALIHLVSLGKHYDGTIVIHSDSELLVRQMKNIYQVRNEYLMQLKTLVVRLINNLGVPCKFVHVVRALNARADKLANLGVDKKQIVPPQIAKIMADYGVF